MSSMNKRVALITGGASDLGAEDAHLLACEGAQVVITDVQDQLRQQIAAQNGSAALYLHREVREEASWDEVVASWVLYPASDAAATSPAR